MSRPTYTIANQTESVLDASFTPCACCSKGSAQWQVPAGETVAKELKVVDEGGGDACDESAAYAHLTLTTAERACSLEFESQSMTVICTEHGCVSDAPGVDLGHGKASCKWGELSPVPAFRT